MFQHFQHDYLRTVANIIILPVEISKDVVNHRNIIAPSTTISVLRVLQTYIHSVMAHLNDSI